MTKENRNLLINTVLVLLVSTLLLLTLVFFIPTTSSDKIFGTKVKLKNKEYFRLPPTVEKIEEAYKGERLLGTVYTVKEDNNYGYVRLKVAIDDKGLIVGIGQDINQAYPEKEHSQQVFNYIESLAGSKVANPESLGLDAVAKPTTVVTLGSVNKILDTVAIHAGFKEPKKPTPPEESDVKFLRDDKVGEVDVKVYEATGTYAYFGSSEGVITYEFSVDETGVLMAAEATTYEHTDGFKGNVDKFIAKLIEDKVSIYDITDKLDGIDGTAGSTNTVKGVIDLIDKVAKFIGGESENTNKDVKFIRDDKVGEVEVKIYEATGTYMYFSDFEGVITYEFSVDASGVLMAAEATTYEHTKDFQENVNKFIEKLISDKVNINNIKDKLVGIDETVGSTNTAKGVIDLLDKVAKFISGEVVEPEPEPEEIETTVEYIKTIVVNGVNLNVYQISGEFTYRVRGGVESKAVLTYNISVDIFGTIKIIEEIEYNHTDGKYYDNVNNYLSKLVNNGANIYDLEKASSDIDGSTGSTNTVKAIKEMIFELRDYILENNDDLVYLGSSKAGLIDVEVFRVKSYSMYHVEDGKQLFGYIMFDISIDNQGIIRKIDKIHYGHSGEIHEERVNVYLENIVKDEVSIYDIKDYEDIDGDTGATNSRNAISDMIHSIRPEYVKIADSVVLIHEENNNYTYRVTSEEVYVGTSKKYLVFDFVIDQDGTIVNYKEIYYTHTESYKPKVIEYLEEVIKEKYTIYNIDKSITDIDGITGSTNSRKAVVNMIGKIVAEFVKTFDEVKLIDEKIVDGVTSKIYRVTQNLEFRRGSFGYISYDFVINESLEIVSYEEIYYSHTESFKAAVIKFLDELVTDKTKISDVKTSYPKEDLDGEVGSTYSIKAFIKLLDDLNTFIEGGK